MKKEMKKKSISTKEYKKVWKKNKGVFRSRKSKKDETNNDIIVLKENLVSTNCY